MSTTAADPTAAGFDPDPRPSPGLWPLARMVLKPLASLQLTVALLALSVGLVFFGTLAQKTHGIWHVVDKYFWSTVVFIDLQPSVEFGKIFFGLPADMQTPSWAGFPYPGGLAIGVAMFVNLLAAHLVRMKLSWRRLGVIVLHLGVLVLFVGEFITREFQVEQQMVISEGSSADYAFDHRHAELAFVDSSDPKEDKVTVVSDRLLKRYAGRDIAFDGGDMPVSVQVIKWFRNSGLVDAGKPGAANHATAGFGLEAIAEERPEVSGVSQDEDVDRPAAYVTLYRKGTTESLGTYLVTAQIEKPQRVEVDGKAYDLSLLFVHYPKPFRMELTKLHADFYPGSTIPKNYASDVRLIDPERGEDRPVTIAMNEPLRYRGEAFYQARVNFDPRVKPTTTLQVVRNPGWLLPYVACGLVTLGMVIHFGINLVLFLLRMSTPRPRDAATEASLPPPVPKSAATWAIPLAAVAMVAVIVGYGAKPPKTGEFDFRATARLPVLDGGRVKPLDTVARKDLRLITHKESFKHAAETFPAIKWYFDAASGTPEDPGIAARYKIFRVENDQLWPLLNLTRREGLRYSVEEMRDRIQDMDRAVETAMKRPEKDRTRFDASVLELSKHIRIYLDVWQGAGPTAAAILPPSAAGGEWQKPGEERSAAFGAARREALQWAQQNNLPQSMAELTREQKMQLLDVLEKAQAKAEAANPILAAWDAVLAAYRDGKADDFNKRVAEFAELSKATVPEADRTRANFEAFLNEFAPAYWIVSLYGFALTLSLVGWLSLPFNRAYGEGFRRAAFCTLALTFVLHTFALLSRMYLMDRPLVFVTNLYSSAVFIGWAAVALCLIVERIFPIGLGNFVAAAIGLGTGIIAHNLAVGGDTLEMMQAVLDTNFWLATHVTTVTLGYSATYVAAVIALVYVALGVFTPLLRSRTELGLTSQGRPTDLGRVIGMVTYGILCLATLFSFVGTVLGGIWADQSWGRFWGWDPKENGAVLIVAWNALILHARWCGLVKDRGVAVLAIAGAIITTWSWFGTNQLGVGLHAYGFDNGLVVTCVGIWAAAGAAMLLGLLPTRLWVSYAGLPEAQPVPAKGRKR